jgi:muconate cycloisomerase
MNASVCALEMALLDAYAREQKMKIIDFFSHDYYASPVLYGAAIPLGTEDVVKNACLIISDLGITRLKLKIGKDFSQNKSLLKIISENISGEYDLKVDVNGVWDLETAIRHLPLLSEHGVKVIEQPMAPGSDGISDFSRAAGDFDITLMADESACSFKDMEQISDDGYFGMVNVRVSKCGGMRRSIKIVDYLRSVGIPFQIGCQLGESGLLSAAGRTISLVCRDAVSHEGSYDALLLAENVTKKNVSFEYGGIAHPLNGIGLGIDIDPVKLQNLSDYSSIRNFKKK